MLDILNGIGWKELKKWGKKRKSSPKTCSQCASKKALTAPMKPLETVEKPLVHFKYIEGFTSTSPLRKLGILISLSSGPRTDCKLRDTILKMNGYVEGQYLGTMAGMSVLTTMESTESRPLINLGNILTNK